MLVFDFAYLSLSPIVDQVSTIDMLSMRICFINDYKKLYKYNFFSSLKFSDKFVNFPPRNTADLARKTWPDGGQEH